ncbi:hypothetical protein JH67_02995 [Listeria monocytogenes]|nr:hypothetical protein [Listeria monocytogenes]
MSKRRKITPEYLKELEERYSFPPGELRLRTRSIEERWLDESNQIAAEAEENKKKDTSKK